MENHDNTPHNMQGSQTPNQGPQGDDVGGSNTIMIVLLIIIVLAIAFILFAGDTTPEDAGPAVNEESTTSVDVDLPADSEADEAAPDQDVDAE